MNITKQDLQKIVAYLARTSVKDSQFQKTERITDDTSVAVVQDGRNRLIDVDILLAAASGKINLSDIPVSISGVSSTNLLELLGELAARLGYGGSSSSGPVVSRDVYYSWTLPSGFLINNVEDALNNLFSIVYGQSQTQPNVATPTDIINVLNSSPR